MCADDQISDREIAKQFGYKNTRSVRDFLATRGVYPIRDVCRNGRKPTMYNKQEALTAYREHPPKQGNHMSGPERSERVRRSWDVRRKKDN